MAFWLAVAKDSPTGLANVEDVKRIGSPNSRSPAALKVKVRGGLGAAADAAKGLPWGEFASSRALWAATAAHSANNWGLYVSLAWLPTYFSSQYGLDLASSSFYSLLPYVAGAVSSSVAGLAADKMLEGGMEATLVRKIMQGIGSFGPMACMVALSTLSTAEGQGPEAASALFVAAVGLGAASSAGFGTSLQDISGRCVSGFGSARCARLLHTGH
jgi:nitrate/nitrite transporter NarK